MGRYLGKRLLYIVLVFFLLSFLIFSIYNLLPVDKAAEAARAELAGNPLLDYDQRYQYWQERYGTNGSLVERYLRWLGLGPYADGGYRGLLQGNLGTSSSYGKPVLQVLKEPMGNTVLLNLCATFLGLAITIPLGCFCALRRGSRRDLAIQTGTMIGYSLPAFIIAIVFIWLFAVLLGWFPVSGMQTAGSAGWPPLRRFWDRLYHLALPLLVMTFCSLGGMTRYVRAAMVEALGMDCIRTARAKGLPERVVIWSHAWRNALLPVVTLIIGWFLSIFSGSLMIENIFALNGIGKVYFDALQKSDNDVILALQMFYILVSLLGNLFTDIAYGLADPRIRVNS